MMSCSQDDVTFEATPDKGVAISFACELSESEDTDGTNDGMSGTRAVIGHSGAMNSEDLYYTGFGVFASQNAGGLPDMMYNQQVTFTFVGDLKPSDPSDPSSDPLLKGYWSYEPIKYWPANLDNFSISAYAPYQSAPISADGDDTGIVGISNNSEAPYVDYRISEKLEDVVDLLWYYAKPSAIPSSTTYFNPGYVASGTLSIKMRHALARLKIQAKVESLPANTKVLIEEISLQGEMAKNGRLSLNGQTTETVGDVTKYYPIWSNQDNPSRTIIIDSDDSNTSSYGIIDPAVRYVDGLPYDWQPDGLTTTAQNALYCIDRQSYVYLIPQETLSLTVKVKYHKMTSEGNNVSGEKTTVLTVPADPGSAPTPVVVNPLRGNTTYTLNLNLQEL